MKTMLTTAFLFAMALFMFAPATAYATSDTLVIYASNPLTLDAIIGGDVNGSGVQLHKVYKLVSTDTTYIFDAAITVKSDITVLGVPSKTTGRPPCIQPDVLKDGTVPANVFVLSANGINVTLQNLYLIGQSITGTVNSPNAEAVQVKADNVRLTLNYVIFEQWDQFAIEYAGNLDKFFIYNCKFRNMVNSSGQWYVGEVLRNDGGNATDSVVMKWNTMFCVNAYSAAPVTGKILTYFEFSHNDVVWSFKNPFFVFNVTDAKINNNLFFAAWSGGISKTEYPWWDQLRSPEVGSLVDLDTLNVAIAKVFDTADSSKDNVRMLAEAKRTVEVKNNAYFWPATVTNFLKAWDDTASVDSVYTVNWMNTRTTNMFTDKTTWPGFVQSGNVNVDPGFGASIPGVFNAGTGNNVGFQKYFAEVRTGTIATDIWGYKPQTVSGTNWVPNWPLPEATDLHYSNTALLTGGTDGQPVGDPYWITGTLSAVKGAVAQRATQFALENAYPNPFNPTTSIKFHLAAAGNVTLNVYNVMGQLVKTVVNNEYKNAGDFNYQVSMDKMTSGVYFYTLTQGSLTMTKKMILMK
jgi:hypothetical protein